MVTTHYSEEGITVVSDGEYVRLSVEAPLTRKEASNLLDKSQALALAKALLKAAGADDGLRLEVFDKLSGWTQGAVYRGDQWRLTLPRSK